MSYYYFDSSLLVKAYLWEAGTTDVRRVMDEVRSTPERFQVVTSRLAFVETASAVARREFAGEIGRADADDVWSRLVRDFFGAVHPFTVLEPEHGTIRHAGMLVRRHRLRAVDAIHLATGLVARHAAPTEVDFHFGSADHRLSAAAAAERFDVFDPRSPIPPGTSTPVAPGG